MDDLYSVLQVEPGADADAIAAAYHRLSREFLPDIDPSPEVAAAHGRLRHAFEVLGNPEHRREYDLERESLKGPAFETPLVPQAVPIGRSGGFGYVLSAILPVVLLSAIGFGVVAAIRDGDAHTYHSDRGDEDYDLAAMALTPNDLPADFEQREGVEFNNEEWAAIFGGDDLDATVRQLEAQGWLRNWVTEATPPRFGKVLNIRSVSTLYTNEAAAVESTDKFACGLPLLLSVPLDPFIVPKIADQSNGFFMEEEIDEAGTTLMYTTVCFRTGRIVHVIQEASLPGLEDIGSSLRVAQSMLKHVDDVFDGKPESDDEEEKDS